MSKEEKKNYKATILRCDSCKKHEYQDQKYGDMMRVHNPKASTKDGGWRCTVCGRTR